MSLLSDPIRRRWALLIAMWAIALPALVLAARWTFAPMATTVSRPAANDGSTALAEDTDSTTLLTAAAFDAPIWREPTIETEPVATPEPTIKAPPKPPYRLLAISRRSADIFEARFIHATKPEGVIAAQADGAVGACAVDSITATTVVLRDQAGRRHTFALDLGRRVER